MNIVLTDTELSYRKEQITKSIDGLKSALAEMERLRDAISMEIKMNRTREEVKLLTRLRKEHPGAIVVIKNLDNLTRVYGNEDIAKVKKIMYCNDYWDETLNKIDGLNDGTVCDLLLFTDNDMEKLGESYNVVFADLKEKTGA